MPTFLSRGNAMPDHTRFHGHLLYLFLFLSGFAGLGCEIVWTRMLSAGLGHEIIAVLAVVAAFFAGLALGARVLDRSISKSSCPGRWYAGLEAVIGLWALVLSGLLPWTVDTAHLLIGSEPSVSRQWGVAFLFPFIILLPATFAMGATLPAMERLFSRLCRSGHTVGGLYAANTFGAVAGTLGATLFIIPGLGFAKTQQILAVVNFLCAIGVLAGAARGESERPSVDTHHTDRPSSRRLYTTLFFTGLFGVGFEVLVIRMLSQLLENTVYSFACILSVYLFGTAVGGAVYQLLHPRISFKQVTAVLLQCLSVTCLIGTILLFWAPGIQSSLESIPHFGNSGALFTEFILAAIIFFLPTVMMGMAFSHLAQCARRSTGGLGYALSVNTIGAAVAPFLVGVMLLPAAGSKTALAALAIGYLFLTPPVPLKRMLPGMIPLAVGGILVSGPFQLRFVNPPPGGQVIAHKEGVMAAVSVVADSRGDVHLKVNNHYQMGGTTSVYSDHRQAHIPLLLHPHPKKALFLGLGAGATFAAAADHPGLTAVAVELLPEVVSMLPYFEKTTGNFADHPQLKIRTADARRYIRTTGAKFDVIVADLFHPARDGAGFLYTVEHFRAVRDRLNPEGIFCQWLPVYQLDLDMIRVIMRSFLQEFPDGSAFLAHFSLTSPIIGLIGSTGGEIQFSESWFQNRVHERRLHGKLAALGLKTGYDLFGCFLADSRQLARFAGKGELNTDDKPVVVFGAPHFVYEPQRPAYERLIAMIDAFDPETAAIPVTDKTDQPTGFYARLVAYLQARNLFIHAGVNVPRTRDVTRLLHYVQEPLLAVVRQSPEFEAAYNPLLAMAQRLHPINAMAAEKLLIELDHANPRRSEARRLREYLAR
jgi:spermidine synthase